LHHGPWHLARRRPDSEGEAERQGLHGHEHGSGVGNLGTVLRYCSGEDQREGEV
ncbi:hypothetical protein FS837_010136, partial [Tulasnella sp. UAMH 9824]